MTGPADYQLVRQQPSTTNNTVIVRDSSYGDAAVGLAAGAVMGAALSNLGTFKKNSSLHGSQKFRILL